MRAGVRSRFRLPLRRPEAPEPVRACLSHLGAETTLQREAGNLIVRITCQKNYQPRASNGSPSSVGVEGLASECLIIPVLLFMCSSSQEPPAEGESALEAWKGLGLGPAHAPLPPGAWIRPL